VPSHDLIPRLVGYPSTVRSAPTPCRRDSPLGKQRRLLRPLAERGLVRRGSQRRVFTTILFTDIVGSTELVARIGDASWRDLLRRHHAIVRSELRRHCGRELDTAGDGFFASFDRPARAVQAASSIRHALGAVDIQIRAGLHTGDCDVSDGKMTGIAVSIGARISSLAAPGEVLVSSTVRDLAAGSGLQFDDRGDHQLKGIPQSWRLFAVDRRVSDSATPEPRVPGDRAR
jgi:class 3 adenylate cyclase